VRNLSFYGNYGMRDDVQKNNSLCLLKELLGFFLNVLCKTFLMNPRFSFIKCVRRYEVRGLVLSEFLLSKGKFFAVIP
jgi:hypothetical protein